jgi:hypothetical protein
MTSAGWVVVTQMASECEEYPGHRCVMDTLGPYGTRDEAVAVAKTFPDWTAPHIGILRKD